uniref:LITAF domain-containing protein n=1 Tax=Strongyloides venezuelensis TaxID=75913 RepID=A0A0K0FTA1_STRVS
MPAVNYGELCSRHGYYSTTTTPPTTTVGVSGAFKEKMSAWTLLAIQIMGYCRPLLEFFILMVVTVGYRRVKRWAKASKKEPCPHCDSVIYEEENGAPGALPSSPPSPPPIFSKEV